MTLHPRVDDRPRSRGGAWPIALVVVLVVATAVRLVGLGDIERKYFDEKYYVTQAQERIDGLEPVDRPAHPPLGTWLIAGSIAVAGDDPFGWRVVPALAGTASVLLAYALAATTFRNRWAGVLAALLVAVDGLAVVTSRLAILDGLQAPFALTAVLAALRWHRGRAVGWLLLAGLAAGAMIAIKWSGVLLLGALLVWIAAQVIATARTDDGCARPGAAASAFASVAFVVGAASAVYVASYTSWFIDYPDTQTAADRCRDDGECGTGTSDRLRSWWWEQWERVDYHRRLDATHPDRSTPLEWPLLSQPVTVYLERCPEDAGADVAAECAVSPGETRRILAVGNPAVWWPSFLALPVLGVLAWRRRRTDIALVVLAPLALWLPWLASPKPGFLYFLAPAVPFLAVVLAGTLGAIGDDRRRRLAIGVVVVAVIAVAAWQAPYAFGWALDDDAVGVRNLFPSWPGP